MSFGIAMTAPPEKPQTLACRKKRRYPTQIDARGMGMIQQEKSGLVIYFYRCGLCGGYHLTKHSGYGRGRNMSVTEF